MRTVFLDTVGLIALWDSSDQWHTAAETAYQSLIASPVRLVTSTLVLFECGNAAARRPYRKDVSDLWLALEVSGNLFEPTNLQKNLAWGRFAAGPPGSAGPVDHVSFVVMEDLNIVEVFSNDSHFRAAGFVTLF